eukprot:479889_1
MLMAELMSNKRPFQKRHKTLVARLKTMQSQSNQFNHHNGGRSSSNKFGSYRNAINQSGFDASSYSNHIQMPDNGFHKVQLYTLNPHAVTMGELYCEFDGITLE